MTRIQRAVSRLSKAKTSKTLLVAGLAGLGLLWGAQLNTWKQLSMSVSPRNSVLISYIMSQNPNPFRIFWSGDWTLSLHNWSTLVEIDGQGQVVAGLAERFEFSPDRLTLILRLRPNLKWSDGSLMTKSQIIESLNVSLEGTTHTDLKSVVSEIAAGSDDQIEIRVKQPAPFVLHALAYYDWAIVHPSTIAINDGQAKVTSFSPSSGRYTLTEPVGDGQTVKGYQLKFNPHHWQAKSLETKSLNLETASILHFGDCNELKSLAARALSFRVFEGKLSKQCLSDIEALGFDLQKTFPMWTLYLDWTSGGKSRIHLSERTSLLKAIHESIEPHLREHPTAQRATGWRFSGLRGALSEAEQKSFLNEISKSALPKRLRLYTMKEWTGFPTYQWLKEYLKSAGVEAEWTEFERAEFTALTPEKISEFDALFMLFGSGDPDPDASFRVATKTRFKGAISEASLTEAYLTQDLATRDEKYKEFGRLVMSEGYVLPLTVVSDIVGVHKSVKLENPSIHRVGISLFDFNR